MKDFKIPWSNNVLTFKTNPCDSFRKTDFSIVAKISIKTDLTEYHSLQITYDLDKIYST